MTGRGAGYCARYAAPGYGNPAGGRGFARGLGRGFGRGFGRGRAWGYGVAYAAPYAAPPAEQELDVLKAQAEDLAGVLEGIQERIGVLEKSGDT